ncbi:hypothetical protein JYU34_003585 [Plutella xylostella]|uniref:Uncharacterized protein n=1 Tax=Plutella xylostella TaxID=51655 RepID=A0ABQ7R0E7_PLUXY|nr:hypothetical protein JYU34_003585 [Plutella xylostella]
MRHCCIIIVLDDIIMVICLDFFRELARDACSAGRRGRDFASRSCYRAIASPEPLKVKIQIINPRYTFSIQSTISVPHSPRRNETAHKFGSTREDCTARHPQLECEAAGSVRGAGGIRARHTAHTKARQEELPSCRLARACRSLLARRRMTSWAAANGGAVRGSPVGRERRWREAVARPPYAELP